MQLFGNNLIFNEILSSVTMDEICRQTVDSGPCDSYEDMFYFDAFSGKCHPFIYGGCGGNMNKYKTKEECEARCGHLETSRNGYSRSMTKAFSKFFSFSYVFDDSFRMII